MARVNQPQPPAAIEYIRLPDAKEMPRPGETETYDASGKPSQDGNVVISTLGVQFIWAKFQQPIQAGQIATMVVTNMSSNIVAGPAVIPLTQACVIDGAATEWDPAANVPVAGDAIIELLAIERGMGTARVICRNTYDAEVQLAAGFAAPLALFPP